MSVPRNLAKIIQDHVTFELECIDWMYLNVYVPALQCESGVVGFFRRHRGRPFASSALMDPMTKSFVAATERFAQDHGVPVVQFQKGQRKDDVMKEQLRRFDKPEGVGFIGKAQEKTPCSAPSGGATPRPDNAILGSFARRRWSTTTIGIVWIGSSAPSS